LDTLIKKVAQDSGKYSLYINLKKIKVMSNTEMDTFKVGGENIEVVLYFKLLGLGRAAMSGLQKVLKDRGSVLTQRPD